MKLPKVSTDLPGSSDVVNTIKYSWTDPSFPGSVSSVTADWSSKASNKEANIVVRDSI